MTDRRFRVLVVAFAATYTWYFTLVDRTAKLPDDVQAALQYSGHGAVLPIDSSLYYAPFIAAMVSCAGLLVLARWGRGMLLLSTVLGVVIIPFAGVSVAPALDSFIGAISATLGSVLLAVTFLPPMAERLSHHNSVPRDIAEEPDAGPPQPNVKVVEVLRSSDPALLAVVESALIENDIPFSLADDAIQELVGAGRLGGYNFALGPARLFIREPDTARVVEILRQIEALS